MIRWTRFCPISIAATIVICVATAPLQAQAQQLTERERELLEMIEALEKRVAELERNTSEKQQPAPSQRLEERVEVLEGAVEDVATPDGNDFRVYWKDGLRFDSRNGDFKLRIGGRVQNDWGFFNDGTELRSTFGDTEDGTEFRRARLHVSGTIYEHFSFKAEYDFAGGDADFREVYMAANGIPHAGQLKVGRFKEPFGFETLMSDLTTTFIERALPNVFAPSYNTGVQLSNTQANDRFRWAVGVFRDVDEFGFGADDGGFNYTGRVTGLPLYKDDGRKLIHLGMSYSLRNIDGPLRLRQRPEAHLAARFVDTGIFAADDMHMYNAEFGFVYGPFFLMAEYFHTEVDTQLFGEEEFSGYYAQASYFLTREHRPYKKSSGTFDRVKPKHNVSWGEERGWGAWELALRYSSLDLDASTIRGGSEDNIAVALNWYLNPNMRVMLNYVHAEIDGVLFDDDFDAFLARFQVDF